MNIPGQAGLPLLPKGMRWKSKVVDSSGTFDPSVEAPLANGYFRVVWCGGGGGGRDSTDDRAGGQAQIFDTIGVIEITGPVNCTIGAGGTRGATGGTGGDTTLSWTNANSTQKNVLFAKGGMERYTQLDSTATWWPGSNPAIVQTSGRGRHGRVNGFLVVKTSMSVTGGEGTFTDYSMYDGGYPCGPSGASTPSGTNYSNGGGNAGCGGWRGPGGNASNAGVAATDGIGYGSGGGCGATGSGLQGGNGKSGCAEFFWMEPVP